MNVEVQRRKGMHGRLEENISTLLSTIGSTS